MGKVDVVEDKPQDVRIHVLDGIDGPFKNDPVSGIGLDDKKRTVYFGR